MSHRSVRLFHRYFDVISLKQINSLAIVFVLLFTILFSTLLIFDESNHFAQTLQEERRMYKQVLFEELRKNVEAITALSTPDLTLLPRAAEAFSQPECCTVLLYEQGRLVWHETGIFGFQVSDLHEGWITTAQGERAALITQRTLGRYDVVAATFTSTMDANLHRRDHEMKSHLIRIILGIATLAFILFAFSLGISSIVNTLIEKDVRKFLEFFERAVHAERRLDRRTIFFREFRKMVDHANEMVDALGEKKRALQSLNVSLEGKVRSKTAELEGLLASQKLFIRHAIHETNTPLAVMMTNIELLELQQGESRHVRKVAAAMKNLSNIFEDLSYLLKQDRIDYPGRRIDLVDYLRSRIDFFTEVARQSDLTFALEAPLSHLPIRINETKLQRIVDNNLTNAVKYSRGGTRIRVVLEREGDRAVVRVISRSKMIQHPEKVFEAYYRESRHRTGFGLGLSLVKRLCDEEGVRVTLTSDEEQTTFTYAFGSIDEDTAA